MSTHTGGVGEPSLGFVRAGWREVTAHLGKQILHILHMCCVTYVTLVLFHNIYNIVKCVKQSWVAKSISWAILRKRPNTSWRTSPGFYHMGLKHSWALEGTFFKTEINCTENWMKTNFTCPRCQLSSNLLYNELYGLAVKWVACGSFTLWNILKHN